MKERMKNILFGLIGGGLVMLVFIATQSRENNTKVSAENASEIRTTVQPESLALHRTAFASVPQDVDFVDAADRTVNAVVHIRTEMTRRSSSYDDFFGSLREYLYGMPHQNRSNVLVGFGSGVVISDDGYIVTNNHVVEGAEKIEVTFNDRRQLTATIIGNDPSTDLALIKVDAKDLPFLIYGDSDKTKVGEWVLAVGNPFNLTSTVTAGIISAKARNINILGSRSSIESFIQTDAVINRGNSGGALVNTIGELIGINAAIASHTGVYEGYSFAIPSNIVRKVVDDLIRYGEPQRAFLGVEIREMTPELAGEVGQDDNKGVYIANVTDNGGASAAGIKPGDVIRSVNGTEVNSLSQLLEIVGQYRPGDRVDVKVFRNKKMTTFNVTLKNQSGTTDLVKREERFVNERLGVTLERVSSTDKQNLGIQHGLRISEINDGVLKRGGISKGFIIQSVNGRRIDSKEDLESALGNSGSQSTRIQGIYPNGMKISFEFVG